MKVILADDVRGLGQRGETVTVKPGYARNFLFPQGFAYEATAANTRKLGEEKKKYDEKMLHEKAGAENVAKRIEGLTVVITKKAGEGDVLYGSVTPTEIAGNALIPLAALYFLAGLSIICHFARKWFRAKILRVGLYGLALYFPINIGVGLLGLFDWYVDFRHRGEKA